MGVSWGGLPVHRLVALACVTMWFHLICRCCPHPVDVALLCPSRLSEHYLALARDLDVMEPKLPEDIYKMHLVNTPGGTSSMDSARANLAATFVNG